MKWFIFRVLVAYYLYRKVGKFDNNIRWCWYYSDGFDNFFDDIEFKNIMADAEYSVDEELSCWSE